MEGHNESRAISDNIDGGECRDELNSLHGETLKKRKCSRRTVNQVEELEAFFDENPRPDPKERLELGRKLKMTSNQVKFWFQRRRSQVKMKSQCEENEILKGENYVLYIQNISMKEAMRNPICRRCGYGAIVRDINVDEHQTRIENKRLKHEIKRIRGMEKKLLGPSASMSFMKPQSDFQNDLPVITPQLTTSLVNEDGTYNKSKLMNLAFCAMNELLKLAEMDEPLWVRSLDGGGETLNLEEYAKSFTRFNGMKPSHFTTEATRASGIVIINSQTLVEILMDKSRWVDIFSCIVGKTSTFDVISSGIGGNRSSTLLLIQTEFQIISDLVPVREIKFLRFCQQLPDGIWVIVDVSVDTIQEGSRHCRRLPSGCIVKEMPNGYSMVTWIEHMEYDEKFVHYLYRPLVRCGLGFGAQRWLTNLQRQSEFLLVMMSSVNATSGHAVCPSNKKGIGMLAKRMTRNFCAGVCATIDKWKIIHLENDEDVKLMMRKNIDDPGEPIGVVLSATKTIRLPVKPQCLFEFFMKEPLKSQQNVLSSSNPLHQMVYIFKDQNLDTGIPPFLANGEDTSANQNNMFFLQDTHADATGSLFVYAKIDSLSLNMVMNGGDSSCVALLPSGIAIVPDCFQDLSGANNNCNGASGKTDNDNSCSGSLVTIGFQVLLINSPDAKLCMESANTVKAHISRTIHYLKAALNCK
ncbi:hypothetical protein HAX54_048165 [Datura stramonium]|uniref:Uncharacterized protein n=1 Tax=Datura stramonium TaxID=4076 RepID=A0ABS8STS9_DATST|nr:hypothetical protein [Datura stramonium]